MSRAPGTLTSVTTAPPAHGVPTDTGNLFLTALTERGPVGVPIVLQGMSDYTNLCGGRVSYGSGYDACDVAFTVGVPKVYLSRVVGPASAAAAHSFSDGGGTTEPTVSAAASSVGDWGNGLTVAVAAGTDANTRVVTVKLSGTVVDTSPELGTVAAFVAWASAYVDFTDLASSNSAPSNLPAVIGDTALTGGTDDRAAVTETHWTNALGVFTANLGPGQVAAPGRTTDAAHQALVAHAGAFNRFALPDLPDTASVSTLQAAEVNACASLDGSYGAVFNAWEDYPGVVPSTLRAVPPSALVAGLCAVVDADPTTDPDQAPMGPTYGVSGYPSDVRQTFSTADEGTLNDSNINVIHAPYGTVIVNGLRTMDTTGDWSQIGLARLRMAIVAKAGAIGDNYVGSKITSATISAFQAELKSMLTDYWTSGGLYGTTAADAFYVDTGSTVNTTDSIAAGHIKATLSLRLTESAEFVDIEIVKVPITQAVPGSTTVAA